MADVTVSLGATINMGGYESARVDYSMSDKVRNYESENDAFDRVERLVEERLLARIKEERESSSNS